MPTTYTHSINRIIHYRFKNGTQPEWFSDSTSLYVITTESETLSTIALPESFSGSNLSWYLDQECTKSAQPLAELDANTQWTEQTTSKSPIGTFISHTVEITLYTDAQLNTIKWCYKHSPNSKKIEDTTTDMSYLGTVELENKAYGTTTIQLLKNSEIAPEIPLFLQEKVYSDGISKINRYSFLDWKLLTKEENKNSDPDNAKYVFKARYTTTSFEDTTPYLYCDTDVLRQECEPYHYGEGEPPLDFFKPLGNDDTIEGEFKVQDYSNNGYSIPLEIYPYQIKGQSLRGINKGTFPYIEEVIGCESPYVTSKHNRDNGTHEGNMADIGEADSDFIFCKLSITTDTAFTETDGIRNRIYETDIGQKCSYLKSITLTKYHFAKETTAADGTKSGYSLTTLLTSTTDLLTAIGAAKKLESTTDLSSSYYYEPEILYQKSTESADEDVSKFTKHAGERHPLKIGFILTGGGGGSGGISQFDPAKDWKGGDEYTTPGGGGGGAEVIYGVIDTHWDRDSDLSVEVTRNYIIYLGNGGAGGTAGSSDVSHYSPGYGGAGSTGFDSRIFYQEIRVERVDPDETTTGDLTILVQACGGFGGGAGNEDSVGSAGTGGSYKGFYNHLLRKTINGLTLCGQIKGGNGGTVSNNIVQNEEFKHLIYFDSVEPPKEFPYCKELDYASTGGNANTSTDRSSTDIPGGHSFGKGGTKDINPTKGAGGCSNEKGGRDGAGGYFGIYY